MMNIYFITVKLLKERYRHEAGLHSDTNIVIANSEQEAIDIMYKLMKPYVLNKSDVFLAKGANGSAETGNGKDVQEYLITPSLKGSKTQWESLDKLLGHYIRYGYHIYDKVSDHYHVLLVLAPHWRCRDSSHHKTGNSLV